MWRNNMGPRHAFRRAQTFANDTGKRARVVYDEDQRAYFAEHDDGPILDWCRLIAYVDPK